MAKRQIFTVQTPLGYRVSLSRDRWRQITRFKHPALAGCEQEVKKCLRHPTIVRESAKEADVHMYYKEHEEAFLCVVTAPSEGETCFVVTAYFVRHVDRGKAVWPR